MGAFNEVLWILVIGFSNHLHICSGANGLLTPEDYFRELIVEEKLADTIIPRSVLPSFPLEPVLNLEKDVTFHLFTRSNPDKGYVLKVGDSKNLEDSPFESSRELKIIIHGWIDSGFTKWVQNMRRNYLSSDDYNVIIVNWFPTCTNEYSIAAKSTEQIGKYVGKLVNFLHTQSNISLSRVHILGHSLGAHVAGFAGASLSGNVGRITGMDPARPAFESPIYKDQKDRLDPSDAIFVDIIHTCAGTVGFIRALGHVDFYPNGGTFSQPGCAPLNSQNCSHQRAHEFMAESIIHPWSFLAIKCDSWSEYKAENCRDNSTAFMGEKVDHESRGMFFLETNCQSPYGQNHS